MIAESVRRHDVLKAERRESEKNLEIFFLETPKIPKKFNIYVYSREQRGPDPEGTRPLCPLEFFCYKNINNSKS